MDDGTFDQLADSFLSTLFDRLDEGIGDCADVDFEGGILTVELDSGGSFVINKHGPNRQVWLSSPVSGAAHFDHDAASGQWINTRDGVPLTATLGRDLAKLTGVTLDLS